jgi:hypothetical protein
LPETVDTVAVGKGFTSTIIDVEPSHPFALVTVRIYSLESVTVMLLAEELLFQLYA